MKLKEKKLDSKLLYECFFMKLYEDSVLLPNEKQSKRIYIQHPGAAAVLAITRDNKIILIKQYRYPVNEILYEIPAGKIDDNEDSLTCVKRELEEETSFISNNISKLFSIYSCVGYSSEKIDIYLAVDCILKENPISGDDDEFLEVLLLSKEEVNDLIKSNQIKDGKTLNALQYYMLNY